MSITEEKIRLEDIIYKFNDYRSTLNKHDLIYWIIELSNKHNDDLYKTLNKIKETKCSLKYNKPIITKTYHGTEKINIEIKFNKRSIDISKFKEDTDGKTEIKKVQTYNFQNNSITIKYINSRNMFKENLCKLWR